MDNSSPRRAALICAHPGHELRVHGWLERERPEVLVLTDGSGRSGDSRVASTAEVLRRTGARPGPVFGRFTDRVLYEIVLEGRTGVLAGLARELADALVAARVELVAGDAVEGFNPSHDLCRLLADTAVVIASRRLGHPIENLEFPLDGSPNGAGNGHGGVRLELDDAALERKLAAARAYPELQDEVDRTLARHGPAAFRVERLRPADPAADVEALVGERPEYERYGEERVAAGVYTRVLRLREHFLPVARALRELAARA